MKDKNKEFLNKVVLVTGGGSGIGRATAIAFGSQGAKVVIASRRIKEGEKAVQSIEAVGGEAIFVKTDLTKATEVKHLIDRTVKTYGSLDYAFNNAGVEGKLGSIIELTEEDWDEVININLKGIWLSMKYQIPQMLEQGKGAIVNNASAFGLVGFSNLSPYCASKHGVIGLTKSLALEFAREGIRINAVCPGAIKTDMQFRLAESLGSSYQELEQEIVKTYPSGRIGNPDEVAKAVLWLCSDGASFITGHSLAIDGGYTIQ